jgi:hypothetical protein
MPESKCCMCDISLYVSSLSTGFDFCSKLGGKSGLRNLGNTCYMNAVLQALIHNPSFRASFLAAPPTEYHHRTPKEEAGEGSEIGDKPPSKQRGAACFNEQPDNISLRYHLSALLHAIENKESSITSGRKVESPEGLHSAIGRVMPYFEGCRQQDSQEFLLHLLERIRWEEQEQTTDQLAGRVSAVDQFTGALMSELKCTKCGQVSIKQEPFTDLSLALPVHLLESRKRKGTQSSAHTSYTATGRKKPKRPPPLSSGSSGGTSAGTTGAGALYGCLVGEKFVDEGLTWQILEVSFQPELQCTVVFYFDVGKFDSGKATKLQCKTSLHPPTHPSSTHPGSSVHTHTPNHSLSHARPYHELCSDTNTNMYACTLHTHTPGEYSTIAEVQAMLKSQPVRKVLNHTVVLKYYSCRSPSLCAK